MEFRIRYNVGDEVWYLSRNKICCAIVHHICLMIADKGIENCHYHIIDKNTGRNTVRTEDYLCGSREEMLDKLTSDTSYGY